MSKERTLNKEEFTKEVIKILKKCGLQEHARSKVVDIGILFDLLQETELDTLEDVFNEIDEKFGGKKFRAICIDYDIWEDFKAGKLGKKER